MRIARLSYANALKFLKGVIVVLLATFIVFGDIHPAYSDEVDCTTPGSSNGTQIFCSSDNRRRRYVQGIESFEKFHSYGINTEKTWRWPPPPTWGTSDPRNSGCLIYGPFLPLNLAGQIAARVWLVGNVLPSVPGREVRASDVLFTFDLTAGRGREVLDSESVFLGNFQCEPDSLFGTFCSLGGSFQPINDPRNMKVFTISASIAGTKSDVEARICRVHPRVNLNILKTEIQYDY